MIQVQRPAGVIKNPSIVAEGLVEVFVADDIDDLATSGVITVATGENLTFDIKTAQVISATRFVLEGTAELRFRTSLADGVYGYSGTGTMISGSSSRVSFYNIVLVSVSTGKFIEVTNSGLNIQLCAIIGFSSLGSIENGANLVIHQSDFVDCDAGFVFTNMDVVNIDRLAVTLPSMTGNLFDIEPATNRLGNVVVSGVGGGVGSNSILGVSPAIKLNSLISVSDNLIQTGTLFDVSGGITGTFTAVSSSSIPSESITGVTDSGGVARFNFTVGPTLFINQEVDLIGFSTSTYNVTGLITATGSGFFEIPFVAFVADDTGTFSGDSVTLTDTATALVDGDEVIITTDNNIRYDGGATVYNQLINSFQINRTFIDTQTGTWDTSGIDETDPRVISVNNPGFPDSTVKAEIIVSGNVIITDIPAVNAKVMINATLWASNSAERVKSDAAGAAIITSREPFSAKIDGNILLEPFNSNKNLSCQFAHQFAARVVVTFSNGASIINEVGTPRVNGDNLTFNDTAGTLPVELRSDIIFFVVNANVNDFQVSYVAGGAAVAFTDDGSGVNSYAMSDLHGSIPTEPIGSNNPRTLVPQSLEDLDTGDKTFITISNNDDSVDILVIDAYYRLFK